MADPAARIARFQQEFPGLWETLNTTQQQRISNAAAKGGTYAEFKATVSAFPAVSAWVTANPGTGGTAGGTALPPAPPPVDGYDWVWSGGQWKSIPNAGPSQAPIDAQFNTGPAQQLSYDPSADIRTVIEGYMQQWGLGDLSGFLQKAISEKWSSDQIIIQLRQTPEYLAVFPENGLRKDNGFSFMPEAQILGYRNEAKRLAGQYLGINVSNTEISGLIGNDKSLAEVEHNLATESRVQQYGPTVQNLFFQELGYPLSDQRLHEFFDNQRPTPELDRAYATALMRGQPESLGLGVRPTSEADALYQLGLTPEQVFQNYQGVAAELPAEQRLAMIENYVNNSSATPASAANVLGDTPFGTLFSAIQLKDPAALAKIQAQIAREVSRFRAGGGPTQSQSGAAAGLLSPQDRVGV